MKMPRLTFTRIVSLAVCVCVAHCSVAEEFTYAPLDDFEDASPWIKGDPNTDLEQKDAAVVPNSDFVKQGKQSLAFMIRVNWTPRPGEKYPRGWPMMSRGFDPPQDWSQFDRVFFWLYTETGASLPEDRVLRCAPIRAGAGNVDWYTLPDIEPGRWQLMSVPLAAGTDFTQVTGFTFYVAEGWYRDGDEINFYVDDMRLGQRTWPVFQSCSVTSRIFPRGSSVGGVVAIEGPPEGSSFCCTVTDTGGSRQFSREMRMRHKSERWRRYTETLTPGGHYATAELLDKSGEIRDSRRQYFRSLEPQRRTYLSLISFYSPTLEKATAERLSVLNASAYAGVAIPLWSGYETDPVPEYEALQPQLKLVGEALEIDPWPWVFTNRFIGAPADAQSHASKHAKDPGYFERIPILDLDNETGARADMLKMWRIAVRAARQWRSPGIVLDMEAYNNYRAYSVEYVAQQRGESIAEVIEKCEAVGAELARIIEAEYPECIVWTLFSRLDRPHTVEGHPDPIHPTPGHISLGFLKYARAHDLPGKYLCGGEVSVGYYNPNPGALREKIAKRDSNMAWALEQFPDHLFLVGTISPYHEYTILTTWLKTKAGEDPELKTIADFQPMFKALFDAYDWVWIYAAGSGRTEPYNPENNRLYAEVLEAALDEAAK